MRSRDVVLVLVGMLLADWLDEALRHVKWRGRQ